ncbi:GrpB family protein [Algoriphagus confluentis]|uniref:GrpB family protein n=1 Tax=Algoriphagus confluentis TaxID=1697556 RepID=A0ABQ6PUA0_9BACT|nr:GrpB family protein [Algoriphagus confluentis]
MILEKYTPNWIAHFLDIKQEIENGLIGIEFRIEHVGSTAVANLDAKPIIDIDIVYQQEADLENIKRGLMDLGYFHNGNQGIQFREVFKRNGIFHHPVLDSIPHHLYACPINSGPLERHVLFRDFLRKNDWARITYQEMKYHLAEKADQDRKRYAELKELNVNAFVDECIAKEKQSTRCLFKDFGDLKSRLDSSVV